MTRESRVLDSSAIVAMFRGHWRLEHLVDAAQRGQVTLLMPTAAIADAEKELAAGTGGWEAVLLAGGIRSLTLAEHTAIEIGQWKGDLPSRHAVHEACALKTAVVTTKPGRCKGLPVYLQVI